MNNSIEIYKIYQVQKYFPNLVKRYISDIAKSNFG